MQALHVVGDAQAIEEQHQPAAQGSGCQVSLSYVAKSQAESWHWCTYALRLLLEQVLCVLALIPV